MSLKSFRVQNLLGTTVFKKIFRIKIVRNQKEFKACGWQTSSNRDYVLLKLLYFTGFILCTLQGLRKNGKSKTVFMGTKFHEKLIFSAFFY